MCLKKKLTPQSQSEMAVKKNKNLKNKASVPCPETRTEIPNCADARYEDLRMKLLDKITMKKQERCRSAKNASTKPITTTEHKETKKVGKKVLKLPSENKLNQIPFVSNQADNIFKGKGNFEIELMLLNPIQDEFQLFQYNICTKYVSSRCSTNNKIACKTLKSRGDPNYRDANEVNSEKNILENSSTSDDDQLPVMIQPHRTQTNTSLRTQSTSFLMTHQCEIIEENNTPTVHTPVDNGIKLYINEKLLVTMIPLSYTYDKSQLLTENEDACFGQNCGEIKKLYDIRGRKSHKDSAMVEEENSFQEILRNVHLIKHHYQDSLIPGRYSSFRNPFIYMLPATQGSSHHSPSHHPTNISGIAWENFERETMRVASFSRYPVNSLKSATVLANSGFVYIGEGKTDKVICYFCCALKEKWEHEEDVETVHKQLSPQCPMVTITESNNTATLSSGEGITSAENYSYSRETTSDQEITTRASGYDYRQQTRARPPSINSQPLDFLDSNRRGQHPASQPSRNTFSAAARANPLPHQNGPTDPQSLHPNINSQIYSIPRVPLSVPPVHPLSQTVNHTNTPLVRDLNLQDLGILYERPKKPEYAILTKRIESFQGWPIDSPVTKENVAKSGLYYEGYGDSGRCFFCGGGLRKWEAGDDPFVEHARWYPKCGYIRQYKGQAFVDIVQIIKNDFPARKQITLAQVVEKMDRLGVTESNAFDEDPVEHDAAVKSLLDEIQSLNSTLRYTREEVIQAAQILRNQSIALSSDLILSQLTQKHDATDGAHVANGARSAPSASSSGTIEELKDQNSTLRNNLICKICMDKEVKIVFLPCGHLVSCQECAVAFHDCPICRSHIRAYVRANIR